MTPNIKQLNTSEPHVYAFEISGEISELDMESMAQTMLDAFDRYDEVNMLLVFRNFQGSETGAGMNKDAMKAQWQALGEVSRYATVGAPGYAQSMIAVLDKVIPVDAKSFAADELDAAWAFVGARPVSA